MIGFFKNTYQLILDSLNKPKRKPKGFEDLKYVFSDSNGLRYYKYADPLESSIERLGKLEEFTIEIQAGLDRNEIETFVKAMKGEVKSCLINQENSEKLYDHLVKLGTYLDELERRKEILLHENLLWDLVGLYYIREDENPALYDQEIHNEKIKQLKKERSLYKFFFVQKELKKFIPLANMSETDFSKLLAADSQKRRIRNKFLFSSTEP